MTNEELAVMIRSGEGERLPELWAQVERFVWKRANSMAYALGGRGGVTAEDLYQAGYFAVLYAVERYDPESGLSFIGLLALCLKTAFAEAAGYRTQRQKRDPLQTAGSLDAPLDDDTEGLTLVDTIVDPAALAEMEAVEERDRIRKLAAALRVALDTLPEDERAVVLARYYQGRTFQDIGREQGMATGRVQRMEQRAMRTLRRPRNIQALQGYR